MVEKFVRGLSETPGHYTDSLSRFAAREEKHGRHVERTDGINPLTHFPVFHSILPSRSLGLVVLSTISPGVCTAIHTPLPSQELLAGNGCAHNPPRPGASRRPYLLAIRNFRRINTSRGSSLGKYTCRLARQAVAQTAISPASRTIRAIPSGPHFALSGTSNHRRTLQFECHTAGQSIVLEV